MQYLLVIIVTPVAVWALDRFLYRGEFTGAVLEVVNSNRGARRKPRKARDL
jgi:hypothetical protein